MPRVLLLNPNMTAAVTRAMAGPVAARLGPGVDLVQATARFGAAYISSETAYAVAGHAALDAWAASDRRFDAVLVGCFGDPGVFALRELAGVPVLALAEASMRAAARHGRFAIVTGGVRWKPMLERLAAAIGLADALAGIVLVAPTGAQLAADPEMADRVIADACRDATALPGVASVIVGGAALVGIAARIQPRVPVPLIDSVVAGADAVSEVLAQAEAGSGSAGGRPAAQPAPGESGQPGGHTAGRIDDGVVYLGVSEALARLVGSPPAT